ncbi:MAG: M23 family metallopeptidase [Pseudomonadota bacterium]
MTTAPMPRLPNPLTPESIDGLMKARPYLDLNHPQSSIYRRLVQRGFEIMYPNTRHDATGRMIDLKPLKPQYIAHLVEQTNREMEVMERGMDERGGATGAVHVQSHAREGGKVEVADYWRARPSEGGASESGRDSGRETEIEEKDQSPQTAESGDDDLPEMTNPIPGGRMRGNDGPPYGSGDFGSSREGRRHAGVDIEAEPGTTVHSPVSGTIVGDPFDPYRRDPEKAGLYQAVTVRTDDGYQVQVFYVDPTVRDGDRVSAGQPIGTAQDLSKAYPPRNGGRMTNHVHVEVRKNGRVKDPTRVLGKR